MNRKGFTLVELLAVVAITAIIILIAIPNVMEALNEARMENFGNEVNTLHNTAKTQFNLEKGRGLVKYIYNGYDRDAVYCQNWKDELDECKNTLSESNGKDMKFKIMISAEGVVRYMYVTNGRFYYACYDNTECNDRKMELCEKGSYENCIFDSAKSDEEIPPEDVARM